MNSRQTHARVDTEFRLMRLLDSQPETSQRELAEQLGLSLGCLNYCLKALVTNGFVKLENFQNSKHKLRYAYMLTPAGIAKKMSMTSHFLKRKLDEYEALSREISILQAEVNTEKLHFDK